MKSSLGQGAWMSCEGCVHPVRIRLSRVMPGSMRPDCMRDASVRGVLAGVLRVHRMNVCNTWLPRRPWRTRCAGYGRWFCRWTSAHAEMWN
jgi:hypothetical protein